MRRVRVALAQVNPTVGAIEANARLVTASMERARAVGADVVALPELVLTGYPPEDLLFKPAFIEANLRALAEVARASRGITAVVGFVDKRDDIFNAAAVLHDGAVAGVYHKQYLPNYGVFDENRYFQSGTESPVFALGESVIAAHLCADIWYPTGPTTLQALGGAELVLSINASPYHAGKGRFREKMLATRAADDLVCLAFVNTVGGQDELIFDGQSFIFNEKGECVARGKAFEKTSWSPTSTSTRSSARGFTTPGAARRSCGHRPSNRGASSSRPCRRGSGPSWPRTRSPCSSR